MKLLIDWKIPPLACMVLALFGMGQVNAIDATSLIEGSGWIKTGDIKIQTESEPIDGISFGKQVEMTNGRQASVALVYQKNQELAWIGLKMDHLALLDGSLYGFAWTGNSRLIFSTETRKLDGTSENIVRSLKTIETDISREFDLMVKERSFKFAFDVGASSDKGRIFRAAGLKIEKGNFVLSLVENSAERVPATIVFDRRINYVRSSIRGIETKKQNVTMSSILSGREAQEMRIQGMKNYPKQDK